MAPLTFRVVPAHEPPATELSAAMVREIEGLYGSLEGREDFPSATPEDFSAPSGVYVAGFDSADPGAAAICGGGIKRYDEQTGELKRMYVVREGRGRGAARALLAALEDAARELGYARVRLDTGPKQPHARALYESARYRSIPDYNTNPAAGWWGEKEL